jgi:hypothetical protein
VVSSAGRRTSDASIGGRSWARYVNRQTIQVFLIAVISGGLLWLVWIYGNGFRDPRYLDGYLLAGGMGLQIYFHIGIKTGSLSPKSAMRWRKLHIFLGFLLIAVFLSHSDFSLPDTSLEWALWTGFVLVTVSGIFGTYLSWWLKAKAGVDEAVSYDRIPTRRAELARDIHAAVTKTDPAAVAIGLPAPPYDAWIMELYATQLREFFQGPRNYVTHLVGSQRPLKRLIEEIDALSGFVDQHGQEKLATIRSLVIEKDRLDFGRVYLGLAKGWLLVHVPVTYGLTVLMVLHILVVHAFSSRPW